MEKHDASTMILLHPLLTDCLNMIPYDNTITWSDDTNRNPRGSIIKETLLANPHLEAVHLLSMDKAPCDLISNKEDKRETSTRERAGQSRSSRQELWSYM